MKQLEKNFEILMREFGSPKRLTTSEERLRFYKCLAETIRGLRAEQERKGVK